MRKSAVYSILVWAVFVLPAAGQVVDTSVNINSWKLMHNYSRFEDVMLDTALIDLHRIYNPLYRNGIAYEHTGMLGHAAQNLDFFRRPGTDEFLFGAALHPLIADPDRTTFYNTRKPFTEIIYNSIIAADWNEETIRFLHTQNMDPFSNIGLDFEVLSGKELYQNEDSRVTKFTLFGSRAKEKYSAFGTFHFNRFNHSENGGLSDIDAFKQSQLNLNREYGTNLANANASYTKLQLFYTQKFMITEKRTFTDSTGFSTDSGKNISFNHQIMAERNSRYYEDQYNFGSTDPFYDTIFYFHENVKDSVVHDKITNTFQLMLGDPYTDPLSARIYAGHEFSRYGMRSPERFQVFDYFDTLTYTPLVLDSVFKDTAAYDFSNQIYNDLFIGFNLAGPPENPWYWTVNGKYYLAGYYRNNFNADATFARRIFKHTNLGLKGKIANRNVSYYHNHYSSAFFQWDNDFRASQLMQGEAFMTNDTAQLRASVSAGILTNYIYWDENALPAQYEEAIYILSGSIEQQFHAGIFHSRNQLLFHFNTAGDVLRIPLAALRTSNYIQTDFFKGALTVQIGAELYITTRYIANTYMPATGVFYLQNDEVIGGYPYLDAFLGLQIKRTRIYASFNNGIALLNTNYFTTAKYPSRPQHFRFGIAWTFYD